MFEQHQASNPVEDLVKGAASGDMVRVEELLGEGACNVDEQFNGRTGLQAAAQNGHIDVVRTLIHYNANLEEEVGQGTSGWGQIGVNSGWGSLRCEQWVGVEVGLEKTFSSSCRICELFMYSISDQ